MVMNALYKSRRRQRGVAAVEFALLVPVLLMMMLATADLGRLLYQYDTLTKATRDGVRYLAAHAGYGSLDIVYITPTLSTEAANLVVYGTTTPVSGVTTPLLPGLTPSDVSVTKYGTQSVSVSVNYTYTPFFVNAWTLFGYGPTSVPSVPLYATVIMRAL